MNIKELDLIEKRAEEIGNRVIDLGNHLYFSYNSMYESESGSKFYSVSKKEFLTLCHLYPLTHGDFCDNRYAKEVYDADWYAINDIFLSPMLVGGKNDKYIIDTIVYYVGCFEDRTKIYTIYYRLNDDDMEYINNVFKERGSIFHAIYQFLKDSMKSGLKSKNKEETKGSVYVLRNKNKNKIGYSKKPKSRIRTIASQGGFKITDYYISPKINKYNELETYAHKHFSSSRGAGEWFNVKFEDIVDFLKISISSDKFNDFDGSEEVHNKTINDHIIEYCSTVNGANSLFYTFKTH